jgi:hypothetical protein
MKKTVCLLWLKPVLVMSFSYLFAFTAMAQNYYPADIGNTWVLESVDGVEQSTYTLEASETDDGEERILLKIRTEELSTAEAETDHYFLSIGGDAIQLHRIVLEDEVATLAADFPTPVTFFPLQLELGDKWQIPAEAEVMLVGGLTIDGKSTTDLEVVGFEDVVTPAGTFGNCAKVRLDLKLTTAFLNLDSTTYQWFAPDIGPVQYENSDRLIFGLVSSNLLTEPDEPEPDTPEEDMTPETSAEENIVPETLPEAEDITSETPPEEEVMPEAVPYDVTGDGVVNILDLTFVASRFGESDSDADVTGDGTVNILDLVLIAQNFGN